MFTIYKVTNRINGKAYIGFDSNWPSRKAVHICEAVTRKNKKYPLYRAMRKYGIENFDWEILYQNEDREYTLNTMENKFIIEHNTHFLDGHGYNMTYGGEGAFGWTPSEETKMNISKSKLGKKPNFTENDIERRRQLLIDKNPMNDPIIKEKHRQRCLQSKTNARQVTDGTKIYDSIRDANKDYPDLTYNKLYECIRQNKNGWSYVKL